MATIPFRLSRTLASQQALERRRQELEAEAAGLARHELMLDRTSGADETDTAADLFDQELTLGMEVNVRAHLVETEAALTRLQTGRYGRCEDCGARIDPKRLRALPQARRCVACQMVFERQVRKRAS